MLVKAKLVSAADKDKTHMLGINLWVKCDECGALETWEDCLDSWVNVDDPCIDENLYCPKCADGYGYGVPAGKRSVTIRC